jgi:hypothetical protein
MKKIKLKPMQPKKKLLPRKMTNYYLSIGFGFSFASFQLGFGNMGHTCHQKNVVNKQKGN